MTTLTIHENEFELRTEFHEKELCKQIPGYRFDRTRRAWKYPLTSSSAREIVHYFPRANASPETAKIVETYLSALRLVESMKENGPKSAVPLYDYPVKIDLYKHQVLAANIATLLPQSAMLMEVGAGKTAVAIAAAGHRFRMDDIRRLLIVAPKSVLNVWPREFDKFADYAVDIRELSKGTAKNRIVLEEWPEANAFDLQVALVNYESAWRIEKDLADWAPDMIICDEAHRLKSVSAAQSKAMHRLGKLAQYRMALTGTPVSQSPLDFFSIMKFVDESVLGRYITPFRNAHAVMGGFEGRVIVGYRDLERLEKRVHAISYRITKEEALPDLPPAVHAERYCELEPSARKIYREMAKESVAAISEDETATGTNILTKTLRLQQIAGGYLKDDDGHVHEVSTAKVELFKDVLTDLIDSGEKVVVFARFRAEIEAITDHLKRSAIAHVLIWGDTRNRGELVDRFQNDPDCKVFVGQIKAAGEGNTLVAASVAIYYSWDYSLIVYEQALGRVHRPGQTRPVTNIHLICKDTMDVGSLDALRRKRNVADAVVDGKWRDLIEGKSFVSADAFVTPIL